MTKINVAGFSEELEKAFGPVLPPLRFSKDGVDTSMCTPDQKAAVDKVLAAHDPNRLPIRPRIATIEAQNPITQRALRESVLALAQFIDLMAQKDVTYAPMRDAFKASTLFKRASTAEGLIAPLRAP